MELATAVEGARERLVDYHRLRAAGLIHREGTFVPAGIHYPPITRYPAMDGEAFLRGWQDPDDGRYVFYVHVPFCKRQCTFCHYPIVTGKGEEAQAEVVELLGRELDVWVDRLGVGRIKARSVLIAGGTPTHLSPRLFRRLHEELTRRVDFTTATQISYDVHPADLVGPEGREKLQVMRDHGSDRLTLGVQSMDEDILKHMNRGHGVALVEEAVEACRRAGFDDLCVEFIFGYPGETLAGWHDTVTRGIALGVEEIQFYRLKILPYGQGHGPVDGMYQRRPDRFIATEAQVVMKQMAILAVEEAGYRENLIRVFTRTPQHTSHYTTDQCCRLLDTIGVGPSAFSSFRDRFAIHEPDMNRWAGLVQGGALPVSQGLVRDRDAQLRWNLLLPLKNSEVHKAFYAERTGERVEEVFRRELDALLAFGLVTETEDVVALTTRGRFFADEICTQLHHATYLPHGREVYEVGPLNFHAEDANVGATVAL